MLAPTPPAYKSHSAGVFRGATSPRFAASSRFVASPASPRSAVASSLSTTTTHVAVHRSRVETPIRIESPVHLNAPKRIPREDESSHEDVSPRGHSPPPSRCVVSLPPATVARRGSAPVTLSPRVAASTASSGPSTAAVSALRAPGGAPSAAAAAVSCGAGGAVAGSGACGAASGMPMVAWASEKDSSRLSAQLKDATMLATAAKRSCMDDREAAARFSMGVLCDNMGRYAAAISAYRAYLAICVRNGDLVGEALACNCIGVDMLLSAKRSSVEDFSKACKEAALEYHRRHVAIGDDAGKLVGHINAGLALDSLGRYVEAAKEHQQALQLAVRIASPFGQSVAVGNLGVAALHASDFETARACWEQHLVLAKALGDKEAEADACLRLGSLANATGDFAAASVHFENARVAKGRHRVPHGALVAASNIGVAVGNAKLAAHMDGIVSRLAPRE